MQQKTHRPLQFEMTAQPRAALEACVNQARLKNENFLFLAAEAPLRIYRRANTRAS